MRRTVILAALLGLGLSLPAQAGEVAGTVFDARGRPAAGVELALGDARSVSAADGTYTFADVAGGEHRVLAGSQSATVMVPVEGTVRRNLFLLSAAARTRVTGAAMPEADNAVLAETRREAARLLAEGAGRPARQAADIPG